MWGTVDIGISGKRILTINNNYNGSNKWSENGILCCHKATHIILLTATDGLKQGTWCLR